MKTRIILWSAVAMLALGAAFQGEVKEIVSPAQPVSKNISFAIYKSASYNSSVYDGTCAQVDIKIEKVKGNERTVVWQKTLTALQLKQYPDISNAISQSITIPGVKDTKEHLEINYTLTYNSNGTKLQMQGNSVVSKGNNDKMTINI